MAYLKRETKAGTDRPWARPGQHAQDPTLKAPTSKIRQNEYESGIGEADRADFSPTNEADNENSFRRKTGPVVGTNEAAAEGRVGEPTPLWLLFLPLVLAIIIVAWLYLG